MAPFIEWFGASGAVYQFELHPIETAFKPIGGVYIFCIATAGRAAGPASWRVEALYVGQTQSFHDRIDAGLHDHHGFKRASRFGANYVAVLIENDPTARLRIETDLLQGVDPICNRQHASR